MLYSGWREGKEGVKGRMREEKSGWGGKGAPVLNFFPAMCDWALGRRVLGDDHPARAHLLEHSGTFIPGKQGNGTRSRSLKRMAGESVVVNNIPCFQQGTIGHSRTTRATLKLPLTLRQKAGNRQTLFFWRVIFEKDTREVASTWDDLPTTLVDFFECPRYTYYLVGYQC